MACPTPSESLASETCSNATGLGPFPDRPAGKLSGGMKQKVGLCGALIHDPDLLILDEPTTGVDPLSRQQFWNLIDHIREQRPGMSVLVSTAYMDEAQRFDWTIAMDAGRVIATGTPAQLMERTGTKNLEEAFVSLLPGAPEGGRRALVIPPRVDPGGEPAIEATDLTKRFGSFTAVNRVSFTIGRGEIFGFLGSNGCGKSTTMKMLTGLLPATEGEAKLFGEPVDADDLATRKRVGYMSQAFSLYGELSVRQNLDLHAKIFDLPRDRADARIIEQVDRFGLRSHLDTPSEDLPLGLKQRLSLAVAVLHEPDMLLLDEPTSGVDPVARDEFWELLIDLSRRQGVTIFVSTHFMNEALRCDRISLMHAGTVLACDTPARLMAERDTDDLETAFIGFIADAEAARQKQAGTPPPATDAKGDDKEAVSATATPIASPVGSPGAPDEVRLEPGPDARLQPPRGPGDRARPGAPALCVPRLGPDDARLRLRHHHRRREHPLRLPGPRPVARESRLSFGFRGLALLHSPPAGPDPGRAATAAQITRDRSGPRGAAQFRPKRSERKRGRDHCLGGRRSDKPRRERTPECGGRA